MPRPRARHRLFNARMDDEIAEDLLERIRRIEAVSWRWRDEEAVRARGLNPGEHGAGVIAQDVEAVFPGLVATDAAGVKSVSYDGLLAVLLEAVKVLDERVRALEAR